MSRQAIVLISGMRKRKRKTKGCKESRWCARARLRMPGGRAGKGRGHASATGQNTGITNPSHPWFSISNHITNSHYKLPLRIPNQEFLTSAYVLAAGSNQQRTNNVNNPPFFVCRRKGTISGSGTALGAITPTNVTNVAMRTLPLPGELVCLVGSRVQRIAIKISTYPTHEQ